MNTQNTLRLAAAAAMIFMTTAFTCKALTNNISADSLMEVIYPEALKPGDKIAIIAPAGPISHAPVDSAAAVLTDLGYNPVIYPHTFGRHGNYSGTIAERWADLKSAFTDPEVRAILCARGGYGVVHNLDSLATLPLREDPKWVIGFSDISALHALMASRGIASVHASMAKAMALGPDNEDNASLLAILRGEMPSYTFEANEYNQPGHAEGRLLGGNLAVIADLINTPFDIIHPGTILFIEDVSEPVYKLERIMYQLKLSGVLPNLKGLIIGQFTEYKHDELGRSTEDMIHEMVGEYSYPVAFGVPVGHVDHNIPLIESATAVLDVSADGATLTLKR